MDRLQGAERIPHRTDDGRPILIKAKHYICISKAEGESTSNSAPEKERMLPFPVARLEFVPAGSLSTFLLAPVMLLAPDQDRYPFHVGNGRQVRFIVVNIVTSSISETNRIGGIAINTTWIQQSRVPNRFYWSSRWRCS